jgi:cytoskeletal protein CcmA (bactofilin family)
MFRRGGTIIAEGLRIRGSIWSEGLVEVNGHIEGDVHCTSLLITPKASINGGVEGERVIVNGRVEGSIGGNEVVLKKHAHVLGDIHHQRLSIERGAHFEGRSISTPQSNMRTVPEKLTARLGRKTERTATREPEDASAA